jgi:hypothetical protein
MAGDLERFLQKAAQHVAQQMERSQNLQAEAAREHPRPSRRQERSMTYQEDDEILEAELVEDVARRQGPNPLSSIDTRRRLAQEISMADENMEQHVHDHLDHDIMNLRAASGALGGKGQRRSGGTPLGGNPMGGDGAVDRDSQVEQQQFAISPLIDMLRDPQTLKQAFIISEIFGRKF